MNFFKVSSIPTQASALQVKADALIDQARTKLAQDITLTPTQRNLMNLIMANLDRANGEILTCSASADRDLAYADNTYTGLACLRALANPRQNPVLVYNQISRYLGTEFTPVTITPARLSRTINRDLTLFFDQFDISAISPPQDPPAPRLKASTKSLLPTQKHPRSPEPAPAPPPPYQPRFSGQYFGNMPPTFPPPGYFVHGHFLYPFPFRGPF